MFGRRYDTPPRPFCGCWFSLPDSSLKRYLPQVELTSHTTILATTSRTVLHQTFVNPLNEALKEVSYTFPLYDGVSVAGFRCTIAGRAIVGVVKERNQARADYQEAISKGQTAGLLEQNVDAADVFTTLIGNVPRGEKLQVEITYLGELKNDAETNGARFTIPTQIAPRYGAMSASTSTSTGLTASDGAGMKITVDVSLEQGVSIRGIQSPSHPIAVTMGRTSTMTEDDDNFENNLRSSTLTLGSTELDKDFVVVVLAKGQDTPRALLETHPTFPNQRALMTTLVPKFNIPSGHPEIVFLVDRSGSIGGKMHLVIEALKVFLKSLPVSVKFNICSFGSSYSFLFEKSKTYDAISLQMALDHLNPSTFSSNYGGTEMLQPVKAVLQLRYEDLPLEVMLLTDGEIWNQDALFSVVNEASTQNARFFTLGIGSSASSSLVEGIARAGRGFSQWVNDGERIDKRLVRMLKGALTPHIKYRLEVKYAAPLDADEDDFEIVESFEKSMQLVTKEDPDSPTRTEAGHAKQEKKKISLFDTEAKDEPPNPAAGRYDHLPPIAIPNVLQVPHQLPALYPHSRSTVYLLLGPDGPNSVPISVTLRGTSDDGDLELEIPVQDVGRGSTIHQLAAKKAMQDLEEGRGWLTEAHTTGGRTVKSQHKGTWDLIVEREAVRLGITFQVGGKFCSFIAIDESEEDRDILTKSPLRQHQESPMLQEQQNKGQEVFSSRLYRQVAPQQRQLRSAAPHHFASHAGQPLLFTPGGNPSGPGVGMIPQDTGGPTKRMMSSSNSARASAFLFDLNSASTAQQAQMLQQSGGGALFGNSAGGFGSVISPALPLKRVKRYHKRSAIPKTPAAAPQMQMCSYNPEEKDDDLIDYSDEEVGTKSIGFAQGFDFDTFLNRSAHNSSAISSDQAVGIAKVNALAPLEKMQKLIDLQSFAGSWAMTQGLLAIISHDATIPFNSAADAERAVGDQVASMSHDVIATVLAITWLHFVMDEESDVWDMVVEKAKCWLEGKMDGREAIGRSIEDFKWSWKI
ncbi:hypothetical protein LTR24_001296 [Lithohypha guttulata]|uniref:VIT-domain-containing protein n=1 Tax=Lithohypha guttulata TaxID=1690604 RepID=A0ABR0KL67_9EURO|nr:hypothetical protein LTR24_001296 [Lithohypha guttulata]